MSENDENIAEGALPRTFLCVVDQSDEMAQAVRFASLRAKNTGGRMALLYVIQPAEFQHWMAVGERMREEARADAEEMMQAVAATAQRITGQIPSLYFREGDVTEQVIGLIDEEPSISLLVLGAATGTDGPGPLITHLVTRSSTSLRVPITIVPGNLTDAQIEGIT